MKTYSKQKRSEDIENCRLCLNMIENGFDIFESHAICIEELIATSLNIIVSEYDGLPSKICKTCYEFLNKLSSFKSQCKTADEWLRKSNATDPKVSALENSSDSDSSDTQLVIEELQDSSITIKEEKIYMASPTLTFTKKSTNENSSSIQTRSEKQVNILHEWEDNLMVHESHTDPNKCEEKIALTEEKPEVSQFVDRPNTKTRISEEQQKPGTTLCPICKKSFRFRHSMLRHLSLHSGEKKYICTICNGKFSQPGVLKRHSLLHTKTKPLSCDICGKGFIQKSNLKTHKRSHLDSDALNFPCELCDKVFKFASGRSRHILQHKGVRYSCTVCSKVMNDVSSFTRHKKRHLDDTKNLVAN